MKRAVLTHKKLTQIAEKWLLTRCGFAFRELSTFAGEIPDAIGFRNGDTILIECKTSRADFLSDKNKHFRRRPKAGVGSFRFYLCPKDVIKPGDLPEKWGLLYAYKSGFVKQIVGPKGNTWSSSRWNKDFYFSERNKEGEMALMYSALRRLHLNNVIPLIYKKYRKE